MTESKSLIPAVYIDTLECPSVKSGELILPDDTAYVCGKDSPTARNGAIQCESFCLRGNGFPRISAGSVATPLTEHELDVRLRADILVLTESGMKEIATVDLGEPYKDHHLSDPLEFAGPEHMFFYRIRMIAGKGGYDPCQTDDLELSLIEGYIGEIHPLK